MLSLARRSEHDIRALHHGKHDLGGPPLQLRFQVGDVVLAHQKLPHLGVPNHSQDLRIMVYYRVCCKSIPWDARRRVGYSLRPNHDVDGRRDGP
jgi:hypothetical protein